MGRITDLSLVMCGAIALLCACGSEADDLPPPPSPDGGRDAAGPTGDAEVDGGGRPDAAVAPSCPDRTLLGSVFFGDLHVHTVHSFDAYNWQTRLTPEDAYRFARGERVGLPPLDADGNPTRQFQLPSGRALDFAAVTDHAEFFAQTSLCAMEGSAVYDSLECQTFRQRSVPPEFLLGACDDHEEACYDAEEDVWQQMGAAADAALDRCNFTTLHAYEWSGWAEGDVRIHRNVVFETSSVPDTVIGRFEQPTPLGLWQELDASCRRRTDIDCDVLAIPHNANGSNGFMFSLVDESGALLRREDAQLRAEMEPLVEIFQHKGNSECYVGVGTNDEYCDFEQFSTPTIQPLGGSSSREALKEGLRLAETLGVNPFSFGFIGSTDTHSGTAGAVEERDFPGHVGRTDSSVVRRLNGDTARWNPGGLAAVWAPQNTREDIFAALQRRETYATSGPRHQVRFFGGWELSEDYCSLPADAAVAAAYDTGVPMGGTLPESAGAGQPRFVVSALADPGTAAFPGFPLEQIQIIKGWYDGGELHEQVVTVVESPNRGAAIDPTTCAMPSDSGSDQLCGVWVDTSYVPGQRAFYYARVLEIPSCRWSTVQCNATVDCSGTVPPNLASCCDASLEATVQERAWTSPIWIDGGAS